ncbi:MAG: protein kinase [Thermoanaerobaculaceae bacterium]
MAGVTVGTPAYMAPEQARGDTVDRRSDVYSLGATLYSLLGGLPPIGGCSPMEVMVRVMTDDPVPRRRVAPGVPRDLETIVHHCLEKDPGRRYDSARALAEDLGRFLDGEPIAAPSAEPRVPARPQGLEAPRAGGGRGPRGWSRR